jgi:hypothetical protein
VPRDIALLCPMCAGREGNFVCSALDEWVRYCGEGFLIFWFVSAVGKISLCFGHATPRSVAFKVCVQINTRLVIGH